MRDRWTWVPSLKEVFLGRTISPLGIVRDIVPMAKGKKGLVFLLEGERDRGVLRLYKDPLTLARTRKIYGLCKEAGVSMPRIYGFWTDPRLWMGGVIGLSLEEWVSPWKGSGKALLKELAHLHAITRDRWGDPLWGRKGNWLGAEMVKVKSRLDRWSKWRRVDVRPYLTWLEETSKLLSPLKAYSLIHADLAKSNLGARGNVPVLMDLDRARFSHPLMDVAALLYHFPETQGDVDSYLTSSGFTPSDLEFFTFLLRIKRLIRALKHMRKGEAEWNFTVELHEEWLMERIFSKA